MLGIGAEGQASVFIQSFVELADCDEGGNRLASVLDPFLEAERDSEVERLPAELRCCMHGAGLPACGAGACGVEICIV